MATKAADRSAAAKKAAATRKANAEKERKAQSDESDDAGPIPGKYSGEAAPEPRVILSEEERRELEHDLRVEHNERTGGGEIHEGELEEQRHAHNRRTAGVKS